MLAALGVATPTHAASAPAPAAAPSNAAPRFRVAGYLPDYRMGEFSETAAATLTDLILFSAEPGPDGELALGAWEKAPWPRLRAFKAQTSSRLILCVGGWGRSRHFPAVAASPEARQKFVGSAVRFCLAEKLDGLDLDWEHPRTGIEHTNYARLLINLREAFAPHGLKLSVTIAPWQTITPEGVQAVDWVQLMAYDHSGPHSTFDHAKAAIATARQSGIPAAQLVLGLPFYGRDPSRRERTLAYREILARHAPGPEVNEADGLFFNGPALIRKKTAIARQLGLAGVMVWELGQDAPPPDSLLQVIHEAAQGR